ncbi:MAG: efflux RND transporter periplasmic adaptor subunit [Aureliella sp.]
MENQFDTSSWNGGEIPLGTSPVASLDSPHVQQTKSEIRALAAEIAELAHSDLSAPEFYEGFLPRLCMAMGATGASIWKHEPKLLPTKFALVAGHQLPEALFRSANEIELDFKSAPEISKWLGSPVPTESHASILSCVVAEAQPILVPPSTTTIEADRPVNPIDEALVLVPIQLEKNIEYLIEVTQRSTGGPAAQRGYLRFVAQMGDLFADFIRRSRLRVNTQRLNLVEKRQDYVLEFLTLADDDSKRQLFADACFDLLDVNQTLCFDASGGKILSPIAVNETPGIDPRNPVFAAVRELVSQIWATPSKLDDRSPKQSSNHVHAAQGTLRFTATDRRAGNLDFSTVESNAGMTQQAVDQVCELLGSRGLVLCRLPSQQAQSPESSRATYCLAAVKATETGILDPKSDESIALQETVRTLAAAREAGPKTKTLRTRALQVWQRLSTTTTLIRFLLAIVVAALCVVPVPQRVSVSALLQPVERNQYYAPADAIVSTIHVEEGQWVEPNQPLLTLTSQRLDHELDRLEGERQTTLERIVELRAAITRGDALEMRERDRLENEHIQQQQLKRSLESQLSILRAEVAALTIRADRSGKVTTWDLSNNLTNRPVKSGATLLTTCKPDGEWELQLSIPDHRIGLIQNALQESNPGSLPVRFSLRSQPNAVVQAELRRLGLQIQRQPDDAKRFLLAKATFPAKEIPLKQNGSIASATIECGRVPLGWLIIRDAYTALRASIELNL